MQSSITKSRTKPRNILKGVVPTADALWGTAPTNLANITDGSLSTVTGTGSTTTAGAATVGSIIFDTGSTGLKYISGLIGFYVSTGSISLVLDEGDSASVFPYGTSLSISTTAATEQQKSFGPIAITHRYFKLRFNTTVAATGNAKIYEVIGHDMGI